MIDADIILEKTNSIQNCLKRIHDKLQSDVNRIEDLDIQEIVVLNLQRAIELIIDIASYVVSKKHFGTPKSIKDLFHILEQNQWLQHELSSKMQKMVGFRNIAVHDYQAIDPEILKSVLSHHLKDLEEFYTVIIKKTQLKS